MATNKGRIIGGYMDTNGNIIEEYANPAQEAYDFIHSNATEFKPSWGNDTAPTVTYTAGPSNTFSNYDVYNLQAQGYANSGDNAMATAYGDLANSLGNYSKYANTTLGAYDNLLNYMAGNEGKLQSAAGKLYNELSNDISNQRNYVNRMFGPDGELTQEVNQYYDDLGNYLATDAGRQAANIAAQGVHSGASLGAIRAQQNEAYNQSFQRYVQAKEQQINAKQQIASNLINFMSTLRKEYGDTTNQYIIEMYKRAADLYEKTAMSALADMNSYNQLQATASGGGSSSSSGNPILDDIINKMNAKQMLMNAGYTEEQADALVGGGTTIDDKGNTITASEADRKAAQEKLQQSQPKSNSTAAQKKQAVRDANAALQKLEDEAWYTKLGGNLATAAVNLTPNRLIDMFN